MGVCVLCGAVIGSCSVTFGMGFFSMLLLMFSVFFLLSFGLLNREGLGEVSKSLVLGDGLCVYTGFGVSSGVVTVTWMGC